jgi:hypothetical protein
MVALAIPVSSPYGTAPGNAPTALLPGQIATNPHTTDRRIWAGDATGTPILLYDPVGPQVINLGSGQPGVTLQSSNATGGVSDTVPVLRMAGASLAGDGWDWRYLTNGDYQQVRRVGGVETVMMHMARTGGISFGGAIGSDWFTLQGPTANANRLRLLVAGTGADPQFQVFSPDADRGLAVTLKGAGSFSVRGGSPAQSLLRVVGQAVSVNGWLMASAPAGGNLLLAGVGADANIPMQIMSQGTGEIRLGCGYPAYSPVAAFDGRLGNTDYVRFYGGDAGSPVTVAAISTATIDATLRLMGQGGGGVRIDGAVGFGVTPIARQTIFGSRSDGTALASLLIALQTRGDILNSTTA